MMLSFSNFFFRQTHFISRSNHSSLFEILKIPIHIYRIVKYRYTYTHIYILFLMLRVLIHPHPSSKIQKLQHMQKKERKKKKRRRNPCNKIIIKSFLLYFILKKFFFIVRVPQIYFKFTLFSL